MSEATSSSEPTDPTTDRGLDVVHHHSSEGLAKGSSDGRLSLDHPATRSTLSRHWACSQDEALPRSAGTSSGGGTPQTPRPEARREGHLWGESPPFEALNEAVPGASRSTSSPTGIIYDQRDDLDSSGYGLASSNDSLETLRYHLREDSPQHTSFQSSIEAVSRKDTNRSSFSDVARGFRRGIPDLRLFDPNDGRKYPDTESGGPTGGLKKLGRTVTNKLAPVTGRRGTIIQKESKMAQTTEDQLPTIAPLQPPQTKVALKDRRNGDEIPALQLNLTPDLGALPPRQRSALRQSPIVAAETDDIALPRPRSPKTPYLPSRLVAWCNDREVIPPPTIRETPTEDQRKHGHGLLPGSDCIESCVEKPTNRPNPTRSRPRNYKGRSTKSDTSTVPSPHEERHTKFRSSYELKQVSKQSRRARWSNSRGSDVFDSTSTDSPLQDMHLTQVSERKSSLSSRLFSQFKRKGQTPDGTELQTFSQPIIEPVNCQNQSGHRTPHDNLQTQGSRPALTKRFSVSGHGGFSEGGKKVASLPPATPPIFQTPEAVRVPTPPLFDQVGELRGKLADFFFEFPGGNNGDTRYKRSPKVPGRVWDSDALLMSQETNITGKESPDDESPQAPPSAMLSPLPTSQSNPDSYLFAKGIPSLTVQGPGDSSWFRVKMADEAEDETPNEADEAERRRFEWAVPEHLPSSPLCPLNAKYQGPWKGVCAYHGGFRSRADSLKPCRTGSDNRGKSKTTSNRRAGSGVDEPPMFGPGFPLSTIPSANLTPGANDGTPDISPGCVMPVTTATPRLTLDGGRSTPNVAPWSTRRLSPGWKWKDTWNGAKVSLLWQGWLGVSS